MADDIAKPRLLRIAEHLQKHGVEFLVLGGEAAVLHGTPLPTYDTDLCYRRTRENLERLAEALRELNPSLADVAERMGIDAPALSRLETGKMLFRIGSEKQSFAL